MTQKDKPESPPVKAPRFLIYDVMSPINLGMILRVCETFKAPVVIYDRGGVFGNADKLKTVSDFACGALQRVPPDVFSDLADLERVTKGRRVLSTTIQEGGEAPGAFRWRRDDLVVLGNEYDGLPDDVAKLASHSLRIPMPDGYTPKPASHSPIDATRAAAVSRDGKPNLNVAMSCGILAYAAYIKLNPVKASKPRKPERAG